MRIDVVERTVKERRFNIPRVGSMYRRMVGNNANVNHLKGLWRGKLNADVNSDGNQHVHTLHTARLRPQG